MILFSCMRSKQASIYIGIKPHKTQILISYVVVNAFQCCFIAYTDCIMSFPKMGFRSLFCKELAFNNLKHRYSMRYTLKFCPLELTFYCTWLKHPKIQNKRRPHKLNTWKAALRAKLQIIENIQPIQPEFSITFIKHRRYIILQNNPNSTIVILTANYFQEIGEYSTYFVDIYKFYFLTQYNYNLTLDNSKTMQPFYLLQPYSPCFFYYPSIYPFSHQNTHPSLTPSLQTQLSMGSAQHKTVATVSSLSANLNIKQKQSEILGVRSNQKLTKGQAKKVANKSIVDSIYLHNRNILPNMTNVVLSYVRRINKSGSEVKIVLKALQCQDLEQTMKKFYAYQNYLKNNVNDFIIRNGVKALMNRLNLSCPCFTVDEQIKYNKVFRIVIRRYLNKEYLEFILSSKKMDYKKRKDHLKVRRYLIQTLSRLPSELQDLNQ